MHPAKPPAIAYLISQYPAVNHTFILREVLQLRRSGLDIHVASIAAADRPPGRLAADEREEAERTYYVKPAGLSRLLVDHTRTALTRPLRYARGFLYALRTARWDLRKCVHHLAYFAEAIMVGCWMRRDRVSHLHTHFSSTVAMFVAKTFQVSLSMTIHGPDEFNDAVGFLLKEKVAASAFICAISNYGRSQLEKVSPPAMWDKIQVAPLGVDVGVFAPRPFRADPDPLEIACVGRLAPAKAQRVLIGAASRLIAEGRSIRVRFVGDGPDRQYLEREVVLLGLSGRIVFEGAVNHDRVRELYRETDVFALASFAEGVPVVLMEAMAMEITCVATWICGIPELIRDEIDGLLVPPSDEEALARAIARLQDDPALRDRLGKAGRQRVMEKYDLTTNVDRLASIFDSR